MNPLLWLCWLALVFMAWILAVIAKEHILQSEAWDRLRRKWRLQ